MPLKLVNQNTPDPTPLEAAKALEKDSNAAAVRKVLILAVAANLDALDEAELIKVITDRTTFKTRQLIKMVKALQGDAQLAVPDGPTLLADTVLETVHGGNLKCAPDGRCWEFIGGKWRVIAKTSVRRMIAEVFRKSPGVYGGKTKPTVDAAFSVLMDRCGVDADPMEITLEPPKVINFQNGELWLENGKLEFRKHSPTSGLVHVLACDYDATAGCPKFQKALFDIFAKSTAPDEMVRHVFELIGYAILPVRNHPKIVFLYGGGANGKSSLLKVLIAMVGKDLVYSGNVGKLSRSNFGRASLAGKLLLVDDDLSKSVAIDDGFLKTISEAKPLTDRRAYGKQEFSHTSRALPILASNHVPRINDASHGFWRRLMVIPFDRKFAPSEIKLDLFEEIIAEELPGIVNEALAGMARLNARGDFKEPDDCVNAKQSFFALANPLRGYVGDKLEEAVGKKVALTDVWNDLKSWCAYNHITVPVTRNQLKSSLEGMGLRVTKSNGLMYLRERVISTKEPSV